MSETPGWGAADAYLEFPIPMRGNESESGDSTAVVAHLVSNPHEG